jgi:Secretion system C-terminal sorting domain
MKKFTQPYNYLINIKLMSKQTLFFLLLCPIFGFSQWNQIGSIDGNTIQSDFGTTTSLDASGDIIAIGAPLDDSMANDAGEVRVFQNNSNVWTQIGSSLFGLGVAGEQYGNAVSLNAPGDILAVGSRFTNIVRVYQNISNVWTQIGADIIGEVGTDNFGYSVSLNGAGDVLAVGAINNQGVNGVNSGHVRVYLFIGTSWIQIGQDIDGEAANDFSGESVSLNDAGTVVAIGATLNDGNGSNSGHARVYEYNSGANTWAQKGSDINGPTVSAFGTSLALSDSGDILAVGAPSEDVGSGTNEGEVRIYQFISNAWTKIGQDLNGSNSRDEFGTSVSLSSDGTILAVGAPALLFGHIDNVGYARIFKNISGTWTQIDQDITAGADNETGTSVSLNTNGSIISVGLPKGASTLGRTLIYENTNILSITDNSFSTKISMFPNPSHNEAIVSIGNVQEKINVSVSNILGKIIETFAVKNTNEIKFETSKYASGIYIVNLQSGNKKASLKLIVE